MNSNDTSSWSSMLVLLLLALCQHVANAGQKMSSSSQQMASAQLVVHPCKIKKAVFRELFPYWPSNYKLKLELNPRSEDFSGEVEIDLKIDDWIENEGNQRRELANANPVGRDSRNIYLNAENLNVQNVEFHQENYHEVVTRVCHDAQNAILVVTLSRIPSSKTGAKLTLWFEGTVNTEAEGLFRSSAGSSHALVTHLKPAYARRLFPCFDEPRFKAKFELTIRHPPGTTALSNMPVSGQDTPNDDSGDFTTTSFEGTAKMSSYSLSLAVGEFYRVGGDRQIVHPLDGTDIAVYAPRGTRCANHMIEEASRVYANLGGSYMGLFVNRPQPLDMINIVAVNMERDGLEGWGLIIMRQDILCEKLAKPDDRINAVTALTNKIVRFWLGNLVTVRWWDDLWFMEGLANYVTNELTAELHPEMSNEFFTLINTTYSAMDDEDDPQKSRPIKGQRLPLTADKIEKSFDSIIYKKSEAVFRMFAQFLSKEKFDLAIREFIRDNAYGTSCDYGWRDQLANSARAYRSPDYDINGEGAMRLIFDGWTSQAGYPIITASINEEGELVVSQESNLGNGDTWPVPISYKLYTGPTVVYSHVYVLFHQSATIDLRFNLDGEDWIKFNVDYQGYYRVYYQTESLWRALVRALKKGYVRPADRMQLLSDSYAHGKRSSMDHFGKLLELFENETHDGVMLLLTRILTDVRDSNWILTYGQRVRKLMINYYTLSGRISVKAGSNSLKQYARGAVLDYLVNRAKDPDVIKEARKYMRNKGNSPPFLAHVLDRFRP